MGSVLSLFGGCRFARRRDPTVMLLIVLFESVKRRLCKVVEADQFSADTGFFGIDAD